MPQRATIRVAILPGNILIDDPSSEWMASAVQLVLQTDLSTSRSRIPVAATDESSAYLSGANQVLRATITLRAGRIYIQTTVTDLTTQKAGQIVDIVGAASSGALPLLNETAKRSDTGAGPFSTKSDKALQVYVAAIAASKLEDRITSLKNAIGIDPYFGLAYIALADAQGRAAPQALPALLQAGSGHKAGFTPYDRVRFDAFLAGLSHTPIAQQIAAFQAVLKIAPNESDALVTLGSLSFLNDDAADGMRYLRRALELNPGDPNVQRALAQGLFETRHFAEAEKVFVGINNNPAVLPELAICVLLQGDATRANVIAERLFASITNPDVKTLFRVVWLMLSGQAKKAVELLSTATFASPAAHAVAYSELSVWQMMANDFNGAKIWAAKALEVDAEPSSPGRIVALLTAANAPAETWRQQVDAAVPQPSAQKNLILGYGFFLGGHYAEAENVWNTIVRQSGDTDLRARTLLAASLARQGKAAQARQIKVQPFVPEFGDLYACVSFFEMNRNLGITVR